MARFTSGWKKDPYSKRDLVHKMKVYPVPERVVLDSFLPDVRNH